MIILRQKEFAVSQQTFEKVQALKQQYPNIGSRTALKAVRKNAGTQELGFVNTLKGNLNKGIHATKKHLSKMSGFANAGIFENQPKTFSESRNHSKISKALKKAKKVDVGVFKKSRPEIEWIGADFQKPKKPIEPVKPVLTWYD